MWPKALEAIINIFELTEETQTPTDEEDALDVSAKAGYSSTYSRLLYASNKTVTEHDPFASVKDTRMYLAQQLAAVTSQHAGKVFVIHQLCSFHSVCIAYRICFRVCVLYSSPHYWPNFRRHTSRNCSHISKQRMLPYRKPTRRANDAWRTDK
jgi:hypothetical protein